MGAESEQANGPRMVAAAEAATQSVSVVFSN